MLKSGRMQKYSIRPFIIGYTSIRANLAFLSQKQAHGITENAESCGCPGNNEDMMDNQPICWSPTLIQLNDVQ